MVARIAHKEFTEMVRDGRFRWAAGIVFILLLAALALGWKNYREVKAQHDAAQRATREQWLGQGPKNPHSAAHYGVYAFKPKLPLSLVDQGLDAYLGVAVYLEAHFQNHFQFRPAEDATALQRFGELTVAIILQLLVPLLIILLSFTAFAGERESGTLRQLLSFGVGRRVLAFGKSLGVAGALCILLIPAATAGAVALSLAAERGAFRVSAPRLALMSAGYLLYFGTFVGLSLTVSALARTARTALIALIAFWIANGLVVPRVAADAAERLYPTPSYVEFWEAVNKGKQEGIDGHNPADRRAEELKQKTLRQYGVEKIEDLPVNFDGIRLQAGEEFTNQVYDKQFGRLWELYARHERVHRVAGLAAPLLAARALSMGLAGTDFAQHRDFSLAAESYRRRLNKQMNDDLTHNSKTGEFFYFADRALWEKTPDFSYQMPGLIWTLKQQVWNWLLLTVWFSAATASAVIAAGRLRI